MDARKFLEDMLSEGHAMLKKGAGYAESGAEYAAEQIGAPKGDENHELYKTLAKGAAGAAAIALALGTKNGGRLAKIGAVAAIGALAYKAYQKGQGDATAVAETATIDAAAAPEGERRARALLRAMIAGAKADGQVDGEERAIIEERLGELGADAQSFFMEELMRPLDTAALAAEARSPQEAAELYTAAALTCGQRTEKEQTFLSALASALALPTEVTAEIDRATAAL